MNSNKPKVKSITLKNLNKISFEDKIEELISKEGLHEKIQNALENKGKVYGYFYEKKLVSCYIFSKEKLNSKPDEEINEKEGEDTTKNPEFKDETKLSKNETNNFIKENISKNDNFNIFIKEKGDIIEKEFETNRKYIYNLINYYILNDYLDFKDKMDTDIKSLIQEDALFNDCAYVLWNSNKLQKREN